MSNEIQAPVDVAMPPASAVKTESGIARVMLKENPDGARIRPDDWIMVHYTGWTTDGKMFDSSKISGKPAVFPIEQLIPGMREALQRGREGDAMRVWIPEELAYKGVPGAPQGTLVFEFEIIQRVTPEVPPLTPTPEAIALHDSLAYQILSENHDAERILPSDTVTLDFIAWKASGERFHSSLEAGEPLIAPVHALFPGFRDVLVHAHEGDIVVIWVPQALGICPSGDPISGDLVFSLEISSVKHQTPGLEAPEDVAVPPDDAQKTASGLAYKCLSKGEGDEHPTASSRVRVHYTGWTSDGEMFDSSVERGEPAEFGLNQVIAGWTEGVQLMAVGDKYRFWIPENLAYRGMPGAPAGQLTFDVELIAVI